MVTVSSIGNSQFNTNITAIFLWADGRERERDNMSVRLNTHLRLVPSIIVPGASPAGLLNAFISLFLCQGKLIMSYLLTVRAGMSASAYRLL